MPKVCYTPKDFSLKSYTLIDKANEIIAEYATQGFDLTLRQLYYQFVARGLIPNSQKEYKRLGSVVNDARLAGFIDWDTIVDRTRNLRALAHWTSPADIVSACAKQFRVDKWKNQPVRPEVWIEKDALVGVITDVCHELDVPYFSCRGYTSQSEMWSAAMRLCKHCELDQRPFIIHLGDHDPSGIDMSRDILDRVDLFMHHHGHTPALVSRIALNMNQVKLYDPPPNPTKLTDSRSEGYVAKFGDDSWELDALEPSVIVDLIRTAVLAERDEKKWRASLKEEARHKKVLEATAKELDEGEEG